MKPISRRQFARNSLLLASSLAVHRLLGSSPTHNMTIGLSFYSLRDLLRSKKLDPLDYPAFAKNEFGLTTIDLWEGGLPQDRLDDDSYLRDLRARATDTGSDLFLLMTGALDATGATRADREAAAARHFPPVHRTSVLGCRYLRVFVKAPDLPRDESVARCVETLLPLVEHARSQNVVIVIEPGASKLSTQGDFLAEVAAQIRHPACRLMPDFGKLTGDVYAGTAAMMPHAAVISAKMHDFDAAGNQIHFDYFRLIRIIRDSGFKGILAIEWEGTGLSPVEGVRTAQRLIEKSLAAL